MDGKVSKHNGDVSTQSYTKYVYIQEKQPAWHSKINDWAKEWNRIHILARG
jgi:hypothetical protein